MSRITSHHFVQLVAGQFSTVLLLVAVPTLCLLWLLGGMEGGLAAVLVLWSLHIASIAAQVAGHGSWIPTRWNAVAFLALIPFDLAATIVIALAGDWSLALGAGILTAVATRTARTIGQNWRQGWRNANVPQSMNAREVVPPSARQLAAREDDWSLMI